MKRWAVLPQHAFVQHIISHRHGFLWGDYDGHYAVIVDGENVMWSLDRIAQADRRPTDKEWAQFVAYRLCKGA